MTAKILRELAELWDPDIPIAQNAAYLKRAQEADRGLETRLSERLDENRTRGDAARPRRARRSPPRPATDPPEGERLNRIGRDPPPHTRRRPP